MNIGETIAQIASELQLFDDVLDRYEYIIEQGHDLPPLDDRYRSEGFKVRGCMSQAWLAAEYDDGLIRFSADSDAVIVRGLIQLLLRIYSNRAPAEILQSDRSLLQKLGLSEIITPGRQNGVNAMLNRIFAYAQEHTDE